MNVNNNYRIQGYHSTSHLNLNNDEGKGKGLGNGLAKGNGKSEKEYHQPARKNITTFFMARKEEPLKRIGSKTNSSHHALDLKKKKYFSNEERKVLRKVKHCKTIIMPPLESTIFNSRTGDRSKLRLMTRLWRGSEGVKNCLISCKYFADKDFYNALQANCFPKNITIELEPLGVNELVLKRISTLINNKPQAHISINSSQITGKRLDNFINLLTNNEFNYILSRITQLNIEMEMEKEVDEGIQNSRTISLLAKFVAQLPRLKAFSLEFKNSDEPLSDRHLEQFCQVISSLPQIEHFMLCFYNCLSFSDKKNSIISNQTFNQLTASFGHLTKLKSFTFNL